MKLHYFRSPQGNFGDDLNAWLWPELMPGVWDDGGDGITFVGVGTILNTKVPQTRLKIVLGSGVGYSPLPPNLHDGSWNFMAVRGPLSARAAGLPVETVITDGAILLGALDGLIKAESERTGGVVFAPHVSSTETGAWEEICARLGIDYIDPRWDFHKVFSIIGNARLVLAEAMHGAIVADTLRVPFVPLVSSNEISSFKWMDWTLSMGLQYRPIRLPPGTLADAARNRLVPLMGQGHLHPAVFGASQGDKRTVDELLLLLSRTSAREGSRGWQRVHKNAKRVWRRIAKPAADRASRGVLSGTEARLLDRATETVRRAIDAASYLSDDRTYDSKRAQMMEKVEMTRQLVGGVAV
jgi:succinoglycan biosynthesis protein ExoV